VYSLHPVEFALTLVLVLLLSIFLSLGGCVCFGAVGVLFGPGGVCAHRERQQLQQPLLPQPIPGAPAEGLRHLRGAGRHHAAHRALQVRKPLALRPVPLLAPLCVYHHPTHRALQVRKPLTTSSITPCSPVCVPHTQYQLKLNCTTANLVVVIRFQTCLVPGTRSPVYLRNVVPVVSDKWLLSNPPSRSYPPALAPVVPCRQSSEYLSLTPIVDSPFLTLPLLR